MAPVNFGSLARGAGSAAAQLLHPRDIFNALPDKAAGYDYLRGPQDQVLDQWDRRRESRDLVIKMNTGSGKTIVGLLVAQSCLNEGAGPVAYLVPDHYLGDQVRAEASRLGIATTDDPRSFAYGRGRAVLVDVFQRLFNGQSVFGVAGSAGRSAVANVGTVIIDDAHACLAKAEQVFRLQVPADEPVYGQIVDLFADDLDNQSSGGFLDLRDRKFSALQQVPPWAWTDRQADVMARLHGLSDKRPYFFAWPLLVDVLSDCRAVLTAGGLEVAPPCLPVNTITGFRQAQRHVYLTATLADDGVLVTDFAADPDSVAQPIVPASAGDIGDRLILVPQQTHPTAKPEEVRQLVVDLAVERNVVVIVPSSQRATYWADAAALVLDKDSLSEGVEQLRANPQLGLVVLVNRYDGVDLPGDSCHVLVIDGVPEALEGLERLDQAQLAGSDLLLTRQVQRLEQGMGRATRSNEDHCVVILLGQRLAERLFSPAARRAFSPATRQQLELSAQVAEQLADSPLSALREVIDQCLARDREWIAASRAVLAPLRYDPASVSEVAKASRAAFDHATAGDYRAAVDTIQAVVNTTSDSALKGYLLQQLAAYLHHIDPAQAQQTQLKANRTNRNLLRPLAGVSYEKLSAPALEQGTAATGWLQQRYANATELTLGMHALLADLDWGPRTPAFEQAWCGLAWHLGLSGQRPEQDIGRGPDGLWALASTWLVCEAKSGAKPTHPVFKDDAKQLSNAMDWFRGQYPNKTGVPVLIHPWATFDTKAAAPIGCRVVTTEKLEGLRAALERLITGLTNGDAFRDPAKVTRLLDALGLTSALFLQRHTVAARATV